MGCGEGSVGLQKPWESEDGGGWRSHYDPLYHPTAGPDGVAAPEGGGGISRKRGDRNPGHSIRSTHANAAAT